MGLKFAFRVSRIMSKYQAFWFETGSPAARRAPRSFGSCPSPKIRPEPSFPERSGDLYRPPGSRGLMTVIEEAGGNTVSGRASMKSSKPGSPRSELRQTLKGRVFREEMIRSAMSVACSTVSGVE